MPYILGHPNGNGFLVTANDVVWIDGDTAGRYVQAGIAKQVALGNTATANAIIESGQAARVQRAKMLEAMGFSGPQL